MSEPLSIRQVEHVARLARLELSPEQVERYRGQLSAVLAHIETLAALDVEGVEPMAHALDMSNRLDEDEPEAPLPREAVLRIAPAVEGDYLAVPKVLDDGGGA